MKKVTTKKSGSGNYLTLDSRSGMSDPSASPYDYFSLTERGAALVDDSGDDSLIIVGKAIGLYFVT